MVTIYIHTNVSIPGSTGTLFIAWKLNKKLRMVAMFVLHGTKNYIKICISFEDLLPHIISGPLK